MGHLGWIRGGRRGGEPVRRAGAALAARVSRCDGKPVGAPLQIATSRLEPFSPDGRLLVASAGDGTQTLWDLRARRRLDTSFPASTGGEAAAHFAPDGDVIIEYLGDGARAWRRYACNVAGRDLTRAEWSEVLPDRDYRRVCAR